MKNLWFVVLLITGPFLNAQEWTADTAVVDFRIRNAGIAVKGTFDSVEIRLEHRENTWGDARLSGRVFAASVDTGIGLRDKHLRDENYFEVQTHPWITMESTALKHTENGQLEGTFRLTLKGRTQEITLPLTYSESGNTLTLLAEFELDRREFGIGGRSLILSDKVRIFVNAVLSRTQ